MSVQPFTIDIAPDKVADLKRRLENTRWPQQLPGEPWERGVPVPYLQDLARYWSREYDWNSHQMRLNSIPQFIADIDGQRLHFLHVRSTQPHAIPLLLLHGWPGSFVEFLRVIEPLANPRNHGAPDSQAFDVVVPSVPGFGFSMPLSGSGWTHRQCAQVYAKLMAQLGYERYGVQGGDIGAFQAPELARIDSEHVIGVHVNSLLTFPPDDPSAFADLDEPETERLARFKAFAQRQMGYLQIQSTRPQTLAYGLSDSPAGQLAWIVEKFKEWTDPSAILPEDAVDRETILTNVSLYWFSASCASSSNIYFESANDPSLWIPRARGTVPTAVAVSKTTDVAIRRFAERDHNVVRWTEVERGGHFLALENPSFFISDVREFYQSLCATPYSYAG